MRIRHPRKRARGINLCTDDEHVVDHRGVMCELVNDCTKVNAGEELAVHDGT